MENIENTQNCSACHSCCNRQKHTPRSEEQLKALTSRLNRAIGQLGGIKNMLEDNRYCGDILIQLSAVQSALESFGYEILGEHLRTCVVENVQSGNTQILDEALALIKKLK
jgi:DNA-binding FrmR family transcriptional regulator